VPVGVPTAVDVVLGGKGGKRIRRGLQLWPVGVGMLKGELYGWLQQHPPTDEERAAGKPYPHGYCHYPQYPEEFFKQVTAEQLVVRITKGRRKYVWENTRQNQRNEALDCRIYARAAAASVGMDRWSEGQWLDAAGSAGITTTEAKSRRRGRRPRSRIRNLQERTRHDGGAARSWIERRAGMAWTQAQLDALEEAIASGVLTVKYTDKEVTYRSQKEMLTLRDMMRKALGLTSNGRRRIFPQAGKGFFCEE
jgi:hypothetical protein